MHFSGNYGRQLSKKVTNKRISERVPRIAVESGYSNGEGLVHKNNSIISALETRESSWTND
jgi:hypothetical protein